jgi:hypothetical protein
MWSGPEMASTKCGAARKIHWPHPTDSLIPEADFSILEGLRGISHLTTFVKNPQVARKPFLLVDSKPKLRNRREITSGFWVIGLQRRQRLLGMSEGHP